MKRAIRAGLCTAVMVVAACGGGDDGGGDATATPGQSGGTPGGAAATATPKALTPVDLANAVGDLYVQALTDLGALMKDRPSAADLTPKAEALKARYVKDLVELGKQRKALSTADRAAVDSRLSARISGVPAAVFTAYSEGLVHYQKAGTPALVKLIQDFNIITQYADFELLKKQAPAEATRLGVE